MTTIRNLVIFNLLWLKNTLGFNSETPVIKCLWIVHHQCLCLTRLSPQTDLLKLITGCAETRVRLFLRRNTECLSTSRWRRQRRVVAFVLVSEWRITARCVDRGEIDGDQRSHLLIIQPSVQTILPHGCKDKDKLRNGKTAPVLHWVNLKTQSDGLNQWSRVCSDNSVHCWKCK